MLYLRKLYRATGRPRRRKCVTGHASDCAGRADRLGRRQREDGAAAAHDQWRNRQWRQHTTGGGAGGGVCHVGWWISVDGGGGAPLSRLGFGAAAAMNSADYSDYRSFQGRRGTGGGQRDGGAARWRWCRQSRGRVGPEGGA
jgi:hypothetical protein